MTTLANQQPAVAHKPPTPESAPLPLEPDEQAAFLRRALSVEEADIILRDECPTLTHVTLQDGTTLLRQGVADGCIRVRACVLSARLPDGRELLLYGPDWDAVLNDARQACGG